MSNSQYANSAFTNSNNVPNNKKQSAWAIMNPVKGRIRLAMILSCLSCVCTLFMLLALALAIDVLTTTDHLTWQDNILAIGEVEFSAQKVMIFALSSALIMMICSYLLRKTSFDISHYASFKLETILRTNLTTHISKLGMGDILRISSGALSKIIYDDVKELHVYVADSTPLYAKAYFMPVLTLVLLLIIDWRLASVAFAVLAFGLVVLYLIMRDRSEIMRQYIKGREQVNNAIIEYVQAMPVVRNFDTGQTTFGRYQSALDNYLQMFSALWLKMGLPAKVTMATLNAMPTLAALLWAGAYWLNKDALNFSTWVAILLLGTGMAEALTPLHNLGHMIDKAKISVGRIQQIMQITPLKAVQTAEKLPKNMDISFDNVSFSYENDKNNLALTDINFAIKANSVTALVGASGAGKTTVVKLLARFWDVTEGAIYVGGVDIRNLPLDTLMQYVSVVFQDTFLFSGTIAENIAQGLPNASLEDIAAAAKSAKAHEFIEQLPNGYNTNIGERGIFLSGGQRQRITIARAILQNRPILLLDEATAFSDPENEALIVEALSHLMQNKTVLLVAHRLSTITDVDNILVFDQGRLIEQGTHDYLLTQNNKYAELWHSYQQAQGWALRQTSQITHEVRI